MTSFVSRTFRVLNDTTSHFITNRMLHIKLKQAELLVKQSYFFYFVLKNDHFEQPTPLEVLFMWEI